MARSKNIHIVNYTVEIEQPDDPSGDWSNGVIQVDALLAEQLGRNIRNGNSFRLVGMGAQLRGFSGAPDQDVGFSGVTTIQYCPVTKNSAGAHHKVFKQWQAQKRLKGAVGQYVRYDDFEVGWANTATLGTSRNSTIRYSGLEDSNSETIVLYGESTTGGGVLSIEDVYNNLNPIAAASQTAFDSLIKAPKFADKFPKPVSLEIPSSFSAAYVSQTVADAYVGQIATGDMIWLPADNHLSHLTGTLNYFFKGVSPDTVGQIADTLKLTITLAYEGWSPLNTSRTKSKGISKATKKTTKK